MREVRIGDELLSFNYENGAPEYSKVRAWLHRSPQTEDVMTKLKTEVGEVVASDGHSLATGSRSEEFAFASDFRIGDTLVTPDGSVAVQSVSEVNATGLYAPLTMSSNYFVAASGSDSMFLAHSFAHVRGPNRVSIVFHTLLSAVELVYPAIHDVDEHEETAYMHPVCKHAMKVFGGLLGMPRGKKSIGERKVKFFAPTTEVDPRMLLEAESEEQVLPAPDAPARHLSPTPPPPPPVTGAIASVGSIIPPFVFNSHGQGQANKDGHIV